MDLCHTYEKTELCCAGPTCMPEVTPRHKPMHWFMPDSTDTTSDHAMFRPWQKKVCLGSGYALDCMYINSHGPTKLWRYSIIVCKKLYSLHLTGYKSSSSWNWIFRPHLEQRRISIILCFFVFLNQFLWNSHTIPLNFLRSKVALKDLMALCAFGYKWRS